MVAKVEQWRRQEEERKKWNEELEAKWQGAIEEWKHNKAKVKVRRERMKDWQQENPKLKKSDQEFKPEKLIPKPKMPKVMEWVLEESSGEKFDGHESSDNEE